MSALTESGVPAVVTGGGLAVQIGSLTATAAAAETGTGTRTGTRTETGKGTESSHQKTKVRTSKIFSVLCVKRSCLIVNFARLDLL